MEVDVLTENISKAVTLLARVAPTRSALPILANLHLATDKGRLAVTATDLELCATIHVGAQVHKEGATTLPAKLLAKMLAKLPNEKLNLRVNDAATKGGFQTTTLQQDTRSLTLEGIDAEDFPPTPKHAELTGTVNIVDFLTTLKKVSFCAAADDVRPSLYAIYIEAEDDLLTLTATDGYTLASFHMTYAGQPFTTLAPLRSIEASARLLAAVTKSYPDEELELSADEKTLHMSCRSLDLTMRPVDGTFPDYRSLTPDSHDARITVIREDLLRELEIGLTLANQGSGIVRLIRQNDKLLVSVRSEAVGAYEALLDIHAEGATDIKSAFDPRYLSNILSAMTEDKVTIDLISPSHAALLFDCEAGAYILMPQTVEW